MTRWPVATFIARRLLIVVGLVILASVGIYGLLYLEPGNVVNDLLGLKPHTQATVHALEQQYHLNESFFAQYWWWATNALHLNFGQSVQSTLPVASEIGSRLPVSLLLGAYGYVLTLSVGIPLGMLAALKGRGVTDRTVVTVGIVGLSTPAFVSGLILIFLFGDTLKLLPTYGVGSGLGSELVHLTLPAVALAFTCIAFVARHTRASVLNVVNQDYVTFARARGLGRSRVLYGYLLRNALIPVVSISTPLLAYLIAGAVLVETTFSIPGIGQLLVQATNTKDVPVVQAVALVFVVMIMLLNLLTDIVYTLVDPRIRFGGGTR